jgi:hypothetical protein
MRFTRRFFPMACLAVSSLAGTAQSQTARLGKAEAPKVRDDRFKWAIGAQGGVLFFSTQRQTMSGIPAAGAHLSIVSRRGGLEVGVDEAFGSDEPTAFVDPNSGNVTREMQFDRLRRYGFTLTGYPVRGPVEPYFGVGFGMLQVVDPRFDPNTVFTSNAQAAASQQTAKKLSASGFVSVLAGFQFRFSEVAAFAQYQVNTAPRQGDLLRGTGQSIMGGFRISLGRAREDIRGGGY